MNDNGESIDIEQVPSLIRHAVRMVAPEAPDSVMEDDRLINDLGFHSLALTELAFVLEDMFQLDAITPEQAMSIEHVKDIESLILDAIKNGLAQCPTPAIIDGNFSQYGAQWANTT